MFWTLLAHLVMVQAIVAQSPSLHPFAAEGKYGFKDDQGIIRIPAEYDGASAFVGDVAAVAVTSGEEVAYDGRYGPKCFIKALKWGFIDAAGRTAIPFRYDEARNFAESKAAVRVGDRWGFIDRAGGWVIEPKFARVHDFHSGLAKVALVENGNVGYVDVSGKLVIPAQYDRGWSDDAVDSVVSVRDRSGYLLLDAGGKVIGRRQNGFRLLGERLVAYRDAGNGPFGLMDVQGQVILLPTYTTISRFSESFAAVEDNGRWNFIDRTGRVVVRIAAEWAGDFQEGLAAVRVNGRTGYVDRTGRMVIAPQFATAGRFSGGLANVCVETTASSVRPDARSDVRCGFIDRTGAFAIVPRFVDAASFEGSWASARDPVFEGELRVNRSGKIVDRPRWRDQPRRAPYGQCQLPPPPAPAPPPPDYRVDFALHSTPVGASVFLVPLWDWQLSKDGSLLLKDRAALDAYLVTAGVTPLAGVRIKSQVYIAIFELQGKRTVAKIAVTSDGPRSFSASF